MERKGGYGKEEKKVAWKNLQGKGEALETNKNFEILENENF